MQNDAPSPGRPRAFDSDAMLTKITALFWEHGFEGTGLRDIQDATGLGKASLYAAFGNKQAMYLAALAHYEAAAVDGTVTMLRDTAHPARSRIDTFLSAPLMALDTGDRRGCFLCNATADRAALDPDTAARVRQGYAKMHAALTAALPQHDKATAQLILTVYSGLRIMVRSGQSRDALVAAKDTLMDALPLD